MNQLRNRLLAIFLLATLVPLGITVWIATSLLDQSLRLASTQEMDELSRSLEAAGRIVYQQAREALRQDIDAGRVKPQPAGPESPEHEGFAIAGRELRYYSTLEGRRVFYARPLGIDLDQLSHEYTQARTLVERWRARDLRRGFFITVILLAAAVWSLCMAALIFWAHRISRPIHRLTEGLRQLAEGNLDIRLEVQGSDEVARATEAFNHTAAQLKQSQERLVYLTRLASWQTLARKMAHEVKNSLTPIRLTMEEVIARGSEDFISQAAGIVIDEVGTLERRVRAFSEFASEPPVRMRPIDLNAVVEERLSLLRNAHPEVIYNTRLDGRRPNALGDEDLVKSILTNLVENAAEAAGAGGVVAVHTAALDEAAIVEVHDSGPGLSRHARESLFQPTISFKKTGMGLGLSIARRSALLSGGDIVLIDSELGGAAFRVTLRAAQPECPPKESSSSTTKRTSAVPSV